MVATGQNYLGKGVYGIADAARILRAPYKRVSRWLDEDDSLVARAFDPSEQTISFAELMEIHFIKMFRDAGVSLQAIRKASQAAAARFHTDYPFAVKRFDTDGKTIFATLVKENKDEELVEDLKKGQYVFIHIMKPFFKKLEYGTSDVSRFWPLSKRGKVVLDPNRQFGRPIIADSGVPTRTLFQAVRPEHGQPMSAVAKWFDVKESDVRAAVRFEKLLI